MERQEGQEQTQGAKRQEPKRRAEQRQDRRLTGEEARERESEVEKAGRGLVRGREQAEEVEVQAIICVAPSLSLASVSR